MRHKQLIFILCLFTLLCFFIPLLLDPLPVSCAFFYSCAFSSLPFILISPQSFVISPCRAIPRFFLIPFLLPVFVSFFSSFTKTGSAGGSPLAVFALLPSLRLLLVLLCPTSQLLGYKGVARMGRVLRSPWAAEPWGRQY